MFIKPLRWTAQYSSRSAHQKKEGSYSMHPCIWCYYGAKNIESQGHPSSLAESYGLEHF